MKRVLVALPLKSEAPSIKPTQKICKKCGENKPLEDFYLYGTGYFSPSCKICDKKRSVVWHTEFRNKYPDLCKERRRKITIKTKHTILSHYSNGLPKCTCCNEKREEFLVLDHIEGGGTKHRKQLGGVNFYAWVLKNNFPSGFRVLCHNCNASLGYYGYCPHKKKG